MTIAPAGLTESLDRVFTALDRADVDVAMREVETIAAPEVRFSSLVGTAVEGRTYDGHDGIRTWLTDLTEGFELSYTEREFREVGNTVVFLAQLKLRGRGSSAELVQELATVFELDDEGRIWRGRTFGSHAEGLEAAADA